MHSSIIESIKDLRRLEVNYNGGPRIIEAHCYGEGRKGHDLLRCFQVSGHSNSGKSEGWKLLIVPEIDSLKITSDNFNGPRPGYNSGGDSAIPTVYAML